MSLSRNDRKATIRAFVVERLASGKGITAMQDDESLLESGVVDSLGLFQLVAFLEETFKVAIGDTEITPENFKSIDVIDEFVSDRVR